MTEHVTLSLRTSVNDLLRQMFYYRLLSLMAYYLYRMLNKNEICLLQRLIINRQLAVNASLIIKKIIAMDIRYIQ
jgi:hypothetical protein